MQFRQSNFAILTNTSSNSDKNMHRWRRAIAVVRQIPQAHSKWNPSGGKIKRIFHLKRYILLFRQIHFEIKKNTCTGGWKPSFRTDDDFCAGSNGLFCKFVQILFVFLLVDVFEPATIDCIRKWFRFHFISKSRYWKRSPLPPL